MNAVNMTLHIKDLTFVDSSGNSRFLSGVIGELSEKIGELSEKIEELSNSSTGD